MHRRTKHLAPLASVFAASLALACGGNPSLPDPGLEGLDISSVNPGLVLPGSTLVVNGSSFVGSAWGTSMLRFDGLFDDGTAEVDVNVTFPARFVDFDRMEVDVDADFVDRMGGEGQFTGNVSMEVDSAVDGELHTSSSVFTVLEVRRALNPRLDTVQSGTLIFVNDKIEVSGGDFLLGGGEGETVAVLDGCFTPFTGGSCVPTGAVEVPLAAMTEYDRDTGSFAFSPRIAGIEAGTFTGDVLIRNRHASGDIRESTQSAITYDLTEPTVFSVSQTSVSLGQYLFIDGGGFVGGDEGGLTLIQLIGTFTPDGASAVPVDLLLVPEFIEGRQLRYVINEDDALGQAIDLRRITGTFSGQITPSTSFNGVNVTGDSGTFDIIIAGVKQLVWLNFGPSYVESLRHFGLRALDQRIRDRIVTVVSAAYDTVNLEVRLEEPTDFSLYAVIDINGPDPNGLGLLGYDNTPGKDVNNMRLFDRIGGVNATTQEDGFPGYGGVFIESLFAFSKHPGGLADSIASADGSFDKIFDTFRPDKGNNPVTASDLTAGIPTLSNGDDCLSVTDRADRVACAIWVLGSLIGTTLAHEVGHSLGLANPFGEGFHNSSDEPNRLMDSGGNRPFNERAELDGMGPAKFCDTEYDYLREILPSGEPEDTSNRPPCF